MKLDFVCIGAQKAGTTTLHDILSSHPDIYLPPRKEAQFFDINERYEKGLNWYFKTFFPSYDGEKYIGNINPNLQLNNRSLERITESFGNDIKIIFILRDPIKRAYSHFLMSKRRGYEPNDFITALKLEDNRILTETNPKGYISEESGHFQKNHLGYAYRSKYSYNLNYLKTHYSESNIKIIFFEEFMNNKYETIESILEFLNIKAYPGMKLQVESNVASQPRSKFIRDLLYNSSSLKKNAGKVLGENIKFKIYNFLDKFNSVPLAKNEKKISPEDSIYAYNYFFREEYIRLEGLLGTLPDNWFKT